MKQFALFLTLLFVLSACSSPNPVGTSAPQEPKSTGTSQAAYPPPDLEFGSAYPAPTAVPQSAYPEPQGEAPTAQPLVSPTALPEPKSDSGHVTGTLLQNGEPARNAILYLAEVIEDDQGQERVASYDRVNSPKSVTDSQGNFAFTDIPPGKYGLVLDVVVSSYLLLDPETGEQFLFTVKGGEVTALGEMDHEDLPIP